MATIQSDPSSTVPSEDLITNLMGEATMRNPVETIETVIASLENDQTAMVKRTDNGYLWKFGYGSVEVFVQLTGLAAEDTFTVWASVLKLPARNEPQLMRKLLEMNWSATLEARFSILNNDVVVVSTRSLADLSPSEISRAITIVATLADDNDEALQASYGAS